MKLFISETLLPETFPITFREYKLQQDNASIQFYHQQDPGLGQIIYEWHASSREFT